MKQYALLISILLTGLFSCKKQEPAANPAAAQPNKSAYTLTSVEGYVAKTAPLTESVTASGTILAAEETELHPEASGRVVAINLPEGKTVRKGELLLKIFDDDLKTQVSKLETQLKQAEITEQRLAELLKVKGVSQQEYDLAALQVQTLKSEIELQRINIRKTELRAPYDGMIGLRNISPGAYVTPATVAASIRSVGALKLDFAVPEKYSSLLKVGQVVTFKVEGNADAYTATVQATEQSIAADTRNLSVRALVKGAAKGLLPGTFAEVGLSLGNKLHALMVPNQAIIPQARSKQVIVSRGGKAQFVTVKTGVRQANMIEILDGISVGDTVATTGVLFLRPDSPVKFSKVD
jgi:membrane fusion protein (multidrug efflux system)